MPPKPVTQAARRGKRVIASPTPSSRESEGEDELESEEEDVVPSRVKGKGKAVPSTRSSAAASDDMDIDEDEQDSGNDELDVIDDDESMDEGEEEMEEDDDEEYEEEAETVPPPRVVPTARKTSNQNRGPPAPVLATPPPPVSAQPKSGLRIRLNISKPSPLGAGAAQASGSGGKRPAREAAKKAGKRTKVVAMEAELGSDQDPSSEEEDQLAEEDELDEDEPDADPEEDFEMDHGAPSRARSDGTSSRAASPSKMTARQRAKGDADLQGGLMALPSEGSGAKKLILTEAERVERREEMARRRKRQTDQRKQDEQDETINRLLRAQTGRSRNKIEAPEGGEDTSGAAAGAADGSARDRGRGGAAGPKEGMIRWVSTLVSSTDGGGARSGEVVCRVGVPRGMASESEILGMGRSQGGTKQKQDARRCAVEGCKNGRKYRSTKKFEVGGCSMEHLKRVNESLGMV